MNVPLGKVEAVLLTHLHSDHMGGLGELMLKAWTRGVRSRPLEVVGPRGVESVVAGLKQAYEVDTEARIAHHGDAVAPRAGAGGVARPVTSFDAQGAAVILTAEDLKVTAFLVDHQPVEPAFGYRFDYKGRSLVISGDTLPSESLRRQAQGADLLLHEVLQPKMLQVVHDAARVAGRENLAAVTSDILDTIPSPKRWPASPATRTCATSSSTTSCRQSRCEAFTPRSLATRVSSSMGR
jgi:ribonuclease Z